MDLCLLHENTQMADGSVGSQTAGRCEVAGNLFNKGKVRKIFIPAGGQKNGIYSGQAMKQYLIDHGIPEQAIVFESKAAHTAAEIDEFLCMAKQRFGNDFKVISVSTWYHIPRICLLWLARGRLVRVRVSWKNAHWEDVRTEPIRFIKTIIFIVQHSKFFNVFIK
jgi:vancomycin permeability regulator SanA